MLPETQQLNVEWLFLTIYNLLFRGGATIDWSAFTNWVAGIWFWIVIIGYTLSVLALGVIVYITMRIFDLRHREEHFYTTLIEDPNAREAGNPRWAYIQVLLEDTHPSKWREAIIEADIMLDEVLRKKGYTGDTFADRIRQAHLETERSAGEAHGIRNRIAHEGSAFDISHTLAQRTIAHYESVFQELKAI
jgi:hypothetical protein